MSENFFSTQEDGSVVFTDKGNSLCYYQTLQRLLQHYMKTGLKYPPEKIHSLLEQFKTFAGDHFISLDDYLEKLPDVAALIQEPNISRFSTFVGKNFPAVLEDVKKRIQNGENLLQQAQVVAYNFPSKNMMAAFRPLFDKAPPLVWPPTEAAIDTEIVSANNSVVVTEATKPEIAAKKEKDLIVLSPREKFAAVPSRSLIKLFLRELKSSPPLNWPLPQDIQEEENQENENFVDSEISTEQATDAEQKSVSEAVLSSAQKSSTMPGREVLQRYGKLFRSCNPLILQEEIANSTATNADNTKDADPWEKLLTLKEFAVLVQKLSKFSKNKDQIGYSQWHKSLQLSHKVCLRLHNLQSLHDKGQIIDWSKELKTLHEKTFIDGSELQTYLREVRAFRRVLTQIQAAIRAGVQAGGEAKTMQSSYPELIRIFENNETVSAKSVLLKMHMLSLQPPAAKKAVSNILLSLLKELKELYNMED